MRIVNSPLRYPGGKAILSDFIAGILAINGLKDGTYVEPYAGGAGAALNLLFAEHVQRIILNDADPHICAFWNAILRRKGDFLRRLQDTPVSIQEWKHQRDIYRQHVQHSRIEVAFASFYLNRCNRSGIMVNGGPIGGFEQAGKWKLDARYNKSELERRIDKIYIYRDRIEVHNMDAIEFLTKVVGNRDHRKDMFIYLDPPYYVKGNQLYLNHYRHDDHLYLSQFLRKKMNLPWLLTYDNVPEIHKLYEDCHRIPFSLTYSAHRRRAGSELLIHKDTLIVPRKELIEEVGSVLI
jgi:DNA adenine methylase